MKKRETLKDNAKKRNLKVEKQEQVKVYVQRSFNDIILPSYANPTDAGMDVYASEEVFLGEQETKIIPTGLKFAIPEGYEIQIRPRSGISLNTPLRIANSPGTIDAGYRGELGIVMTNTSPCDEIHTYGISEKGNKKGKYIIKKGDRIAQIVLQRVPKILWSEVEDVGIIGVDRCGGFGSTGV